MNNYNEQMCGFHRPDKTGKKSLRKTEKALSLRKAPFAFLPACTSLTAGFLL